MRWRRVNRAVSMSDLVGIAALLFLLAPFIVLFGASFDVGQQYHLRFPPEHFTFRWYMDIPAKYFDTVFRSLMIGTAVAALSGCLGLMASLGIVRGSIRKELWNSFFRIPVQIPLVVTGAVFLQFYYQIAGTLGFNPLDSSLGLIVAHTFVAMPYSIGAISAVLVRANDSIEEAAQGLGATPWGAFRQVTFPYLRPGIIAGMFYAFITSFGDVPIAVYLVTADQQTFPVQIFQDMQFDLNPGMLAISSIVAIASLVLMILAQRFAGIDFVLPSKRSQR